MLWLALVLPSLGLRDDGVFTENGACAVKETSGHEFFSAVTPARTSVVCHAQGAFDIPSLFKPSYFPQRYAVVLRKHGGDLPVQDDNGPLCLCHLHEEGGTVAVEFHATATMGEGCTQESCFTHHVNTLEQVVLGAKRGTTLLSADAGRGGWEREFCSGYGCPPIGQPVLKPVGSFMANRGPGKDGYTEWEYGDAAVFCTGAPPDSAGLGSFVSVLAHEQNCVFVKDGERMKAPRSWCRLVEPPPPPAEPTVTETASLVISEPCVVTKQADGWECCAGPDCRRDAATVEQCAAALGMSLEEPKEPEEPEEPKGAKDEPDGEVLDAMRGSVVAEAAELLVAPEVDPEPLPPQEGAEKARRVRIAEPLVTEEPEAGPSANAERKGMPKPRRRLWKAAAAAGLLLAAGLHPEAGGAFEPGGAVEPYVSAVVRQAGFEAPADAVRSGNAVLFREVEAERERIPYARAFAAGFGFRGGASLSHALKPTVLATGMVLRNGKVLPAPFQGPDIVAMAQSAPVLGPVAQTIGATGVAPLALGLITGYAANEGVREFSRWYVRRGVEQREAAFPAFKAAERRYVRAHWSREAGLAAWREELRVLCAGCDRVQMELATFEEWRRREAERERLDAAIPPLQ